MSTSAQDQAAKDYRTSGARPTKPQAPKHRYWTAADAADSTATYAERAATRNGQGITLADPTLQKLTLPMFAGHMYGVIAATGEGKTFFANSNMAHWANQTEAMNSSTGQRNYVVNFRVEEPIEEAYTDFCRIMGDNIPFAVIEQGRIKDPMNLRKRLSKWSGAPVIFVGSTMVPDYNLVSEDDDGFGVLSALDMFHTIKQIHEESSWQNPSLIVTGNGQMLRSPDPKWDDTRVVRWTAKTMKRMAMKLSCPLFAEWQARDSVKDRDFKVPYPRDAEFARMIAQLHTGMIGQWYQKMDLAIGADWKGRAVGIDTFVQRIGKWRWATGVTATYFLKSDRQKGTMAFDGFDAESEKFQQVLDNAAQAAVPVQSAMSS